jgi:hypothetical protein
MVNVTEEADGSLTITWNENDPVESQLNTWTEQDFIDVIMDKCKELENVAPEVTGDAEITFKNDGKEVFKLTNDSGNPLGFPGTVAPKTKLHIDKND